MARELNRILCGGLVSAALVLFTQAAFGQASSSWNAVAKIVAVDARNSPNAIAFQLDSDAGSCTAGSWLIVNPQSSQDQTQAANAQAFLEFLQSANQNGMPVTIAASSTGCSVQTIQMTQS